MSLVPFVTYIRLYTLHQIENPGERLLIRIRIQTLRYSFAPLSSTPLDAAYHDDPRAGIEMARQTVLPRLHGLLDSGDPFRELGLMNEQDAAWRGYALARGLSADPVRVPLSPMIPSRRLPARSKTSERLARLQQALEIAQTAADTASTLAAAWQNFQIGRERRKLIETQRILLQDAIQAQLRGQGQALDHALDQTFVRGYLADHSDDSAYGAVFDEL
jgi:hypothetical protein